MESYPQLDAIGYVWHPKLKLLFCLPCHSAVSPGMLKFHSCKPGHDFAQEGAVKLVTELTKDCSFGDREGRVPKLALGERLPPSAHLESGYAYQCPDCGKLYGERESVKRHNRKVHGEAVKVVIEKVRSQQLFTGRSGVWVPITEATEDQVIKADDQCAVIADRMQMRLAQFLQVNFKPEWTAKDAWPYLKAVPWHLIVEANQDQYEIEGLRAMVTIPPMYTAAARGTFPSKLAILVQDWVLGLEGDVRGADYRLKQWLGTENGE